MSNLFNGTGGGGIAIAGAIAIAIIVLIFAYYFRAQIRAFVHGLKEALGWMWFVVMWLYPAALYGIGYVMYYIVTVLTWLIPIIPSGVVTEILGLVLFGVLGWVAQWMTSSSPSMRLSELIADYLVSGGWFVVTLSIAFAAYYSDQGIGWTYWIVYPAVYSTIEFVVGGVFSLRNAYQKNPTDFQKADKS